MTYYILFEGEKKENLIFDSNILGESTKVSFYPNRGFSRLITAVEKFADTIENVQIFDESGKTLSVSKFLDAISKLKLIQHD